MTDPQPTSTRHTAEIVLHMERTGNRVDEKLFGLHLEHIWNCVYPCVWVGPESDTPHTDGIRNDTVHHLRALRPTVCKYPGGYFTDFYDWRDGVGPHERRPAREYPCVPRRVETNAFGTAEFVTFCRQIGAEPYLSVNTTSIEPSDAAHWVEYCNGTRPTLWADRRRQDGFAEPFNVRYWAIGNEPYWLHTPEIYAERFRLWAHWMSNINPSITLVAGGVEPGLDFNGPCNVDGKWGERLLATTRALRWWRSHWHTPVEENQALYSFHPYFSAQADCTDGQYYEAFLDLTMRLPRSIASVRALLDEHRDGAPRPKLCFDEYGLLHPGCRMDRNMTQPAQFWSALWLGVFFHLCFEHAGDVGMATHPGPINMEHQLLLLEENRVVRTPSFYVFRMLRAFGGADMLQIDLTGVDDCPALGRPGLLCVAAVTQKRDLVLSVINLDLQRDVPARVLAADGAFTSARAVTLFCENIHAVNSAARPNAVGPTESHPPLKAGTLEYAFPRHSVTVLHLSATA